MGLSACSRVSGTRCPYQLVTLAYALGSRESRGALVNGGVGRRTHALLHVKPSAGLGTAGGESGTQHPGLCGGCQASKATKVGLPGERGSCPGSLIKPTQKRNPSPMCVRVLKSLYGSGNNRRDLNVRWLAATPPSWGRWSQKHHKNIHESNDPQGQRARGSEARRRNAEPLPRPANVSEGGLYLSYGPVNNRLLNNSWILSQLFN